MFGIQDKRISSEYKSLKQKMKQNGMAGIFRCIDADGRETRLSLGRVSLASAKIMPSMQIRDIRCYIGKCTPLSHVD